jgi:hypothetical protein
MVFDQELFQKLANFLKSSAGKHGFLKVPTVSILVKPSWSADVIYPLKKPELEKLVVVTLSV